MWVLAKKERQRRKVDSIDKGYGGETRLKVQRQAKKTDYVNRSPFNNYSTKTTPA